MDANEIAGLIIACIALITLVILAVYSIYYTYKDKKEKDEYLKSLPEEQQNIILRYLHYKKNKEQK